MEATALMMAAGKDAPTLKAIGATVVTIKGIPIAEGTGTAVTAKGVTKITQITKVTKATKLTIAATKATIMVDAMVAAQTTVTAVTASTPAHIATSISTVDEAIISTRGREVPSLLRAVRANGLPLLTKRPASK
jgi:hypothetical protein